MPPLIAILISRYEPPQTTDMNANAHQARRLMSRIAGNSTTSRIERVPVRIITRRSIPIPIPPVGGIPYSSAVTNASS